MYRDAWTNNADAMSMLYTGTPALKTDFTRTGKRTYKGAMNDGYHSLLRYFINNFTDGYFHDCLDVSTCRLTPKSKFRDRSIQNSAKFWITLTIVLTFFMSRFVSNALLP